MSSVRQLFGGAMECVVPDRLVDVSGLREVPDNQEVFCDVFTDQSLIVELLDMNEQVADEDAAEFHFRDVAEANGAVDPEHHVVMGNQALHPLEALPRVIDPGAPTGEPAVRFAGLLYGRQYVAKFRESARNDLGVFMLVVRLPRVSTDVLVTLNVPVLLDPRSSSASVAVDAASRGPSGTGATGAPDEAISGNGSSPQSTALAAAHQARQAAEEARRQGHVDAAAAATAIADAADQAAAAGSSGSTAAVTDTDSALAVLSELAASLTVKDWSLFVPHVDSTHHHQQQ